MAKRSDRGPEKLRQTRDLQSVSEMSTGLANDHQGQQRTTFRTAIKAGYKTAMNPPSQSFKNPLATREASI
jgi:hypothetical protein